jgi:PUA-domain protein
MNMPELALKKRHRMKKKMIRSLVEALDATFGVRPDWVEADLDQAKGPEGPAYILDGEIVAIEVSGKPAFSLRGLLKHRPPKKFITVDMGAVSFIYNGADVMAPGVTDADMGIMPGDPVYVRDKKNLQPLAVGEALVPGPDMVTGDSGAVMKTLHRVGDLMWLFGHEDD